MKDMLFHHDSHSNTQHTVVTVSMNSSSVTHVVTSTLMHFSHCCTCRQELVRCTVRDRTKYTPRFSVTVTEVIERWVGIHAVCMQVQLNFGCLC